jgi:hypothetical protein
LKKGENVYDKIFYFKGDVKMKNVLKVLSVLLSVAGLANATVVLQDDFNGTTLDTSKWTAMTNGNNVSVGLTGTGELKIGFTSAAASTCYGIQSTQSYSVTGNQKLVIDVYGTNYGGYDTQTNISSLTSDPVIGASPKNSTAGYTTLYESWAYTFESYLSWLRIDNPAIWTDELNVAQSYYEDEDGDGHTNKSGAWTDGEAGPESYTLGKYAHSIITIDANNINFYYSDSAFTEGMTPNATFATSQAFTSEELTNGLYVYLLAYSFGNTWNSYECYDGVTVSMVPEPVTMSLMLGAIGFGLIRRRK